MNPAPQHRRNISLSDSAAEQGRALGDGNLSRGIRRALDLATNQRGTDILAAQRASADTAERITRAIASLADAQRHLEQLLRDTNQHRSKNP